MVKDTIVRARILKSMKGQLEELAEKRGEGLSVLIREAIYEFLRTHNDEIDHHDNNHHPKP